MPTRILSRSKTFSKTTPAQPLRCGLTLLKLMAAVTLVVIAKPTPSPAAILLEEGGKSVKRLPYPKFSKTAEDGLALRKIRRVGVGLTAAGALGGGGANLELAFTPETSFVGGFGGGPGFQSFTLQYKNILGGRNFLPYFAAGFSRWYSTGETTAFQGGSTPSMLADRFLTDSERSSGLFAVNLIHPSLGMQVVQPSGPWAGSSVFFELVMLLELRRLESVPTGTLGFMYYF